MRRARIYLRTKPTASAHGEMWAGENPVIAHADQVDADEAGFAIDWSAEHATFIPHANVLLVEFEPCACAKCSAGDQTVGTGIGLIRMVL